MQIFKLESHKTLPECKGLCCLSFVCLVWARWLHLTAWPDLKQPLRLSWTERERENGVRSNQHCCHDYVQFTPTCNQATGRAATKPMWQWQEDWMWTDGQEAGAGGWRGCLARCSLVLSSLSHLPTLTLYRDQLLHHRTTGKGGHFKQKHYPLSCFVLVTKIQCILHYHLQR